MPQLVVPDDVGTWPTLGPQVCEWMEAHLCFGPGDLLGDPLELSAEQVAWLCAFYEVFPRGAGEFAGRRRFKRCCLQVRKGLAKTELAACVAIAELHPEAPVRCDGWRKQGRTWVPVGRPVVDPYVPMVASTEEQTEDLAYHAVMAILEHSPAIVDDFDIGLERVMRRDGRGVIKPLAGAPAARDGARTTFQHFDESHRMLRPSQKKAHQTMLANIPKRKAADAWSLETTTAYEPGAESVAEDTHAYATAVAEGRVENPRLFFFSRWAGDAHDLGTKQGRRDAVVEATGADAMPWTDLESIVAEWDNPKADVSYLERVWTNRITSPEDQWCDPEKWRACRHPQMEMPPDGSRIGLGFDGSSSDDSTFLVGCTLPDGDDVVPHVFVLGAWERDPLDRQWRVSRAEVDGAVHDAFGRFDVVRFWPDPSGWFREIEAWGQEFGADVVDPVPQTDQRMAPLCDDLHVAVETGCVTHDGNEILRRHMGNARGKPTRHGVSIQKESKTSLRKIDGAIAAVLAHGAARAGDPNRVPDLMESVW